MTRDREFTDATKRAAIARQDGVCAFCGMPIDTPWSEGKVKGEAHHLRPVAHGGSAELSNCVYLCWPHHLHLGHGMAPLGIDPQGGSSSTWVQLERDDFPHWSAGG